MEYALERPLERPLKRPGAAFRRQAVGKKSVQRRARVVRRGVVVAAIVILLALTFVWTRVRVIQLGYEVSQLNRVVGDLLKQKNRLEVEVAKLKSPDRLEVLAKDQFHMRLPMGEEIVFVKKGEK